MKIWPYLVVDDGALTRLFHWFSVVGDSSTLKPLLLGEVS